MTVNGILHALIYLQIFVMGALAAVAARYVYEHYMHTKAEPEEPQPIPSNELLPEEVKQRLLAASQHQFQTVMQHSSNQLQHDLQNSASQISDLVNRLATDIVASEMAQYRQELANLRQQASREMGGIHGDLAKYQAELKAKLAQDIEAEKKQLIQKIETKLADAVGAFLMETLQYNADLGSQGDYLISMLEKHKAEFVKGVADESG